MEDVEGLSRVDYWRDRNVLVTGANGFLGAWIARALIERGARVLALVRDVVVDGGLRLLDVAGAVSTVYGTLEDLALIERALNEYEVQTCFHLAAQAIVGAANRSPLSTFESNIRGTWHLLEACRRVPSVTCIVVASSDKAYGRHDRLPYGEDFPLQPSFPYDVSKACADMLARSYFHTYGLPVSVTRCANLYGGGDLNFTRIVPDSVRSVLGGRNPVIRSDGSPVRDYLYVQDAVEAYLTLAERMEEGSVAGEAFNFGTGRPVSVLELVTTLISVSGRTGLQPDVRGRPIPGEIDRQYLESDKARRVLGWQARHGLEDGLKKTLHWYAGFLGASEEPPS
jgi:CDP-glucose 4,6-dehydratase